MFDNPYRSNLTGDLGLLFKAVFDAFRSLAGRQPESYWNIQRRRCEDC